MFLDPRDFPLTTLLESRWKVIRHEFEQLAPHELLSWPEKEICEQGWEVFGLWGAGQRFDANCQLCPQTAATVDSIADLTTAGFSRLAPATQILPHEGYTNTVLRCHLGLIVPGGCGIQVGDETRTWQEGKCLVFDDTIRHSAWNNSALPRIILSIDFIRPGAAFDPAISAEAAAVIEALSAKAVAGR